MFVLTASTIRKLCQNMVKCFALRQLAQNQFQTDGIRDEILSSYTLSCMSYHTMYPILVHKNLSVMAGFEPASDTSKPKEGSRSRSATTGEGRKTTPISVLLLQNRQSHSTKWNGVFHKLSGNMDNLQQSPNRNGHSVRTRHQVTFFRMKININ